MKSDLRDDAVLVHLYEDVVAPECSTAATPADPAQAEPLHGVLTGQRGHAALRHFKTANRRETAACSRDTAARISEMDQNTTQTTSLHTANTSTVKNTT